uniref:Uncharacterized protein n=1 Tax=Oryza meridionalis TaxID=40149 RepID=A0A0E0DGN5_9ORYZ
MWNTILRVKRGHWGNAGANVSYPPQTPLDLTSHHVEAGVGLAGRPSTTAPNTHHRLSVLYH